MARSKPLPRSSPAWTGTVVRQSPHFMLTLRALLPQLLTPQPSVKRERARLDWTQEHAAESAGNIRHYQKVEEGTVNVSRTVELLAEAFGVDVADMFRR